VHTRDVSETDRVDDDRTPLEERLKYQSDYFAYLESPTNESRYTAAIDPLVRLFGGDLRVLDLGCGTAMLASLLPPAAAYTGVDHDVEALSAARDRAPSAELVQHDTIDFCTRSARDGRRWHAVTLAGLLFHNTTPDGTEHFDDTELLRSAASVLEPDGVIAILAPFAFTDQPERSMWEQAAWKLATVNEIIEQTWQEPVDLVHQSITRQIGIETAIASQTQHPDWWTGADESPTSRFCGHYLATIVTVLRPTRR